MWAHGPTASSGVAHPNHQYHERLDTHCMVLERRADIECGDTMIYTMEKR